MQVEAMSQAETARFVADEYKKWRPITKAALSAARKNK
jgi:hypothetical protein